MRILFLSFIPIIRHVGGMQKVTDCIISEMKKRGHEVIVVYYEKRKIPVDFQFPCQHYYLDTTEKPLEKCLSEWGKIIDHFKPDCIINTSSYIQKSCFLLKNTPQEIQKITINHLQPFQGIEHTKVSHQYISAHSPKFMLIRILAKYVPCLLGNFYVRSEKKLFKNILQYSDKYCVLTNGYIDRTLKYYPKVEKEKLFAIPNPNPYWDDNSLPEEKQNIILYVGRLSNYPKNLISFVRVWQRLERSNPDWRAIVVGTGPILNQTKSYCEKNHVGRISFEGQKRNVQDYYKKSKIVCVTSFFESWNMSLVEGMNYGCVPVAYQSYEATYDIIDHQKNGFLITPFSEKEMADRIQSLIDHPDTLCEMSQNAVEKAKKYSTPIIVDKWEQLIANK